MNTVAIVGTGLIGASFGLALRKSGFAGTIVGVSSPRAIESAVARGAIERGLPLEEAAARADLIFLAQPIGRILDTIRHLDPLVRPQALVTDAGSTKCEIVDTARQHLSRCQFLGGHPMAGKETRGAASADGGLFEGRTWVLTPDEKSELATPAARALEAMLRAIGARLVVMDADEHDRVVSLTSHLPQMLSTALASVVSERVGAEANLAVAGPGLVDSTRLALSAYELWRDIVTTNTEHIDRALAACVQKLEHMRENLRTRQLQEEFERGAELARRVRQSRPRQD
jgi:prephenate dehydrogenase